MKTMFVFLALPLLAILSGCPTPTDDVPDESDGPDGPTVFVDYQAKIPDPKLRAAMESATGKTFGSITFEDLEAVDWLVSVNEGLSDLTGIDYCVNLEGVFMFHNQITDLAPLAKIKTLKEAWLQGNDIASLEPLVQRPGLRRLFVSNTLLDAAALSVLTPQNFPDLDGIGIGGEYGTGDSTLTLAEAIAILAPFKDQLKLLTLFHTPMGDAGFTTFWSDVLSANAAEFEFLNLNDSQITEASFSGKIGSMTNLTFLYLTSQDITDVSGLAGLTKLTDVSFAANGVTDLAPLQDLYDAGAFRQSIWGEGIYLNVNGNGLDLRDGEPDKDVVDYLIAGGVRVDYQDGNTID